MRLRSRFIPVVFALAACEKGAPTPVTATPPTTSAQASTKPTSCISSDEKGCTTLCDAGDLESCVRLAETLQFAASLSSTIKKDEARSMELLRRACDKKVGKACYWLATRTKDEAGVAKAKALVVADCETGDAASCSVAADLASDDAQQKKYTARAGELYRKAFEASDWDACGMYAGVLMDKKDWTTAISVMTKGCDHDEPECCKWLGGAFAEGDGVAKDPARATESYRKACKLGSAVSCAEAAKSH